MQIAAMKKRKNANEPGENPSRPERIATKADAHKNTVIDTAILTLRESVED